MLPLTGAFTATSPKSLIQSARSNVILTTLLLISAIFLTSCGVSGASAYAPSNTKATKARSSESENTREAGGFSSKAAESSSSVQSESSGHITVAATFPHATVGSTYNAVVSVSGGKAPYQFSIFWGALPAGLTINPTTGTISGTPTKSGTYQFGVLATDLPNGDRGDHRMTLVVDVPTAGIIVEVSPANATVVSGGTQQFTATVTGTNNVAVTWSATAGTVSSSGLYTAPIVKTVITATVTATSVAQPSSSDSASVTINPQGPPPPVPTITTTTIPDATAGVSYLTTLAATGGKLPYQWSIASGKLPSGIQLNSNSGSISGLTTATGSFSFDAQVTDAAGQSDRRTFTLLVLTSDGGNCGPPTYNCSRTDLNPAPQPNPVPNVGNLTGSDNCFSDPDFGNKVCRLTDSTTDPSTTTSMVTASSSGDANLWNIDSTLMVIGSVNGMVYPRSFDPTTMQSAPLYANSFPTTGGLRFPASSPSFSRVNSQYLSYVTGTSYKKYDFTDRSTPPMPSTVIDFKTGANCLGSSFTSTWSTPGGVGGADAAFAAGFSNSGGQGGSGALYVVAYTVGSGCRMLNTSNGRVTGDYGPTGTVSNWTAITGPSGFKLHNVKISKGGDFLVIVSTDSSCPTCKGPYFWEIGTMNVTQVGSTSAGGHWTEGYRHFINNNNSPIGQYRTRTFTSPGSTTSVIPNMPGGLAAPFDSHQGWNNVDANDTYPFFTTSWAVVQPSHPPGTTSPPRSFKALKTSPEIFAHTFSTAKSHRFNDQQIIGAVSQDGRFYMWSSDWMGTLGSETGGTTCTVGTNCRGDVFVVEAH